MSYICRMALVLVALFLASIAGAMLIRPGHIERFAGLNAALVPKALPGVTQCDDVPVDSLTRSILSTGDIVEREYMLGPERIDFVLIGGENRDSMHDPRLCLTGSGKQLVNDHTEILPGTTVVARSYLAETQPGQADLDVLYFFLSDGQTVSEYADIRRSMLFSELTGRQHSPIFFFRFIRSVDPNPILNEREHANMCSFAARMWSSVRTEFAQAQSS